MRVNVYIQAALGMIKSSPISVYGYAMKSMWPAIYYNNCARNSLKLPYATQTPLCPALRTCKLLNRLLSGITCWPMQRCLVATCNGCNTVASALIASRLVPQHWQEPRFLSIGRLWQNYWNLMVFAQILWMRFLIVILRLNSVLR